MDSLSSSVQQTGASDDSHRLSGVALAAGVGGVLLLHAGIFLVLYRGRVVSHWSIADSDLLSFASPLLLAFCAYTYLLFRSRVLLSVSPIARAFGILAISVAITFISCWLSLLLPFNLYGT